MHRAEGHQPTLKARLRVVGVEGGGDAQLPSQVDERVIPVRPVRRYSTSPSNTVDPGSRGSIPTDQRSRDDLGATSAQNAPATLGHSEECVSRPLGLGTAAGAGEITASLGATAPQPTPAGTSWSRHRRVQHRARVADPLATMRATDWSPERSSGLEGVNDESDHGRPGARGFASQRDR